MPWKYSRVVESVSSSHLFTDEKYLVCSHILLMMDFLIVFSLGRLQIKLLCAFVLSFLSGEYRGWEKLAPMVGPLLSFKEMVKLPFHMAISVCLSSSLDKSSGSSLSSPACDSVSIFHGSHLWEGSWEKCARDD